jgi:hypothetical protein
MSALTYKGRPVPFIAAWSLERVAVPPLMATPGGLAFEWRPRDAAGVAWKPWLDQPGAGEPEYGYVHGPRQRLAMQSLLCQVCGQPVERDELGYPWLLEDQRGEEGWPEREVTTHPPVCPECQPGSAIQCRHLRGRVASVRVGRVLTDGVHGQMYTAGRPPAPVGEQAVLFAGDARLRWMLGAQIAATLLDVTVVDMRTQAPVSREAVRR